MIKMASNIKTRTKQAATIKTKHGTVKAFERSLRGGRDIKAAYDQTQDARESASPDKAPAEVVQFAEERALGAAGKKAVSGTFHSARAAIQVKRRYAQAQQSIKSIKPAIKTVGSTAKSGMQSIQSSIKTAKNMIKTANTAAKTSSAAVKTSSQTARASYQAAKYVSQATVQAVKLTVKATIEAVKVIATAVVDGVEAIGGFIAAGGWIAVAVIVVLCVLIAICCSVYGIFFSGEDNGTGITMQMVVQDINLEYENRIEEIKNSVEYDVLEMSGTRSVWKDVLAVYAVRANTDPDDPQEVATIDEAKKELIKNIFWEMNELSSNTETKTETVITETDDGNGNIVQTESTVTRTYLYITVSHKTAEDMANKYGFNSDQRQQLSELLADENNLLWSQVIYGITGGYGEIVSVALTQVGNVGGQPYWSWYGFNSRVEWCACFVSWCANECGYIEVGIIPKFSTCTIGVQWFKDRGQWQDQSYMPSAGDLIFFDWSDNGTRDGVPDHVGIVEHVDENYIYTVEGNSSDMCRQNKYRIGSDNILGYGIPAY